MTPIKFLTSKVNSVAKLDSTLAQWNLSQVIVIIVASQDLWSVIVFKAQGVAQPVHHVTLAPTLGR